MAKTVLHPANTRGHADHGWLKANFSFSFANYYDAHRIHFGVLRVLNDDIIEAGMGFGTHPHDNMEIITIPLEGALAHKDSMGNGATIKKGDVQVMSAGTGIQHSEFNPSNTADANTLQIWIFPNKKNVSPRYQQITLDLAARKNTLQQILSPNPDDAGVWIHQDAWFHIGDWDKDFAMNYLLKREGNGVYVFVLEGEIEVEGLTLHKRDAMGIWETDSFDLLAKSNAELLLIEVPMTLVHHH